MNIWKTNEIETNLSDVVKSEKISFRKIASEKENLKFYEEVIEMEFFEKMKEEISKKKKVQLEKIQKIKIDLKELLEENEKHEDL